MDLVTVYITNYNYSQYIEQSIDSVLAQSYQNIEIIIIDDGSNDGSIQKIDKYSDIQNIKIIHQKNKGLNKSNNVALRNSNGKYIMRLDADDFLHFKAVEELVKGIKSRTGIAAIFPDYFNVDIHGNVINRVRRNNFDQVTVFDLPAHGACTLFHKKYILSLGAYDEAFDRQDGYDIWIKIISRYQVTNLNKPLFYYRQHGSNLTTDSRKLLSVRAKIKNKFWNLKFASESTKTNLIVIPTRGFYLNNKSLHMKMLGGKPVISWTIDEALKIKGKKYIVLTTPCQKTLLKMKNRYGKRIHYHLREKGLSNYDISMQAVLDKIIVTHALKNISKIALLYCEFPFRSSWQITEALQTLDIFDVDSIDAVISEDSYFYKNKGQGLEAINYKSKVRHERNDLYRRTGGINTIKYKYFTENHKILGGRVSHVILDKLSSFKINDEFDLNVARKLTKEFN